MNEWAIPLAALIVTLGALVGKLWTSRGGSGVSIEKVWDRMDAVRRELDERIDKVGSDIAKQHAHWQESETARYEREMGQIQHAVGEFQIRLNHLEDGLARRMLESQTVIDFLMRQARLELLIGGLADKQSPIRLTADAVAAITPLPVVAQVVRFYRDMLSVDPPPTEHELFLAIEQKFRDQLIEQICIPYRMHLGGCVILVMDIAKALIQSGESHG